MRSAHSIVGHWKGGWDEPGIGRWAANLRSRLDTPAVTLGVLFATPAYADLAPELLEVIRLHARVPRLIGSSTHAVLTNDQEHEGSEGLALGLFHLPGADLPAFHVADPHDAPELVAAAPSGWLAFADPFQFDGENWLREWNQRHPHQPMVGGLASGQPGVPHAQLYLDGQVYDSGAVVLGIGGRVRLETVVSQGCTPVGEPWTITRTDRNFILTIGNRPAYTVLVETFNRLSREEQERAQGNLFVGFASSEYCEELRRGDFLVRNVLGGDPRHGVIAVGALPRAGQTIQFQTRDARAASTELAWLLSRARERLAGRVVLGGVLSLCLGRGERLFGRRHHDAGMVQEQLGPLPTVGFFGNGEIGPVGDRSFLHGYTAALGLLVQA